MRDEDLKVLREHMVAEISADAARVRELTGKSRLDERVMAAIAKVPRHEFVPIELQPLAYANMPLPIGCEKTISQPFIVALMTDLLDISAEDVVLEIQVESSADYIVCRPVGELDAYTAPRVKDAITEVLAREPRWVVVNMDQLTFLASRCSLSAGSKLKPRALICSSATCAIGQSEFWS